MTTFFSVEPGPEDAPDLGVLEIVTPVSEVTDEAEAAERCQVLNTWASTSRWILAPAPYNGDGAEWLSVACSFVVSPRNQSDLESFAAWCATEQAAAAAAELTGESIDTPSEGESADELAIRLQRAFLGLRDEMIAAGKGSWFSPDPSAYPLSCEMPANWFGYGEEIRWDPERGGPPTARVQASITTWGALGGGLLITMWVPAASSSHVHALNRLNEQAPGATHWIGAWAPYKEDAVYLVFLSAALLEQDIAWSAVMRELLLTFARQAQLARRVLFDEMTRSILDGGEVQPVGFQASLMPRGLAWGETGEGRNPVAWYLDGIFERLVGDDTQWAYPADDGFTWWPHEQAQTVTAVRQDDPGSGLSEIVRIRLATEVRAGVDPVPETLVAIARRNAGLAESALVLRDDGTLVLACQLVMTEGLAPGAHGWIQDAAIRQFVTARELASELRTLGSDPASAHPVSGPRPEPDWWFAKFEEETREIAEKQRADAPESRTPVALIAAGGQYALPYRLTTLDGGGLEFSWRPEHTHFTVPDDPEIRVTAMPGADDTAPAWIIRSRLPVTGDDAARARWCSNRNAELLLAPESPLNLMVTGGWGLTPDGECCLTTGQTRRGVRDDEKESARALGYLLREVQSAVVVAVRAAPDALRTEPLMAAGLAAGLEMLPETFGRVFGERPDMPWATETGPDSVLVTCGDTTAEVPVGYGRAPLAVVYGELLSHYPNAREWLSLFTPFPGRMVDLAFAQLEDEGDLWTDEGGNLAFDAGNEVARLELTRTGQSLRVDGVAGFLAADRTGVLAAGPGAGRLGVTIPPGQYAWPTQAQTTDVLTLVAREVIAKVRHAALIAAQEPKPSLPTGRPRLFGSGRFAAAGLRGRLLELLGAEPDWLLGTHDGPQIIWNSGVATTVFEVAEGAASTPDLGVLRVWTPVCSAGNGNAARDLCARLNGSTGTARWSVAREPAPDGTYYDEVQVSCAFVVGPHNADTLESFALWCVREQIAMATSRIRSGDMAEAVAGVFSRYVGFPGGDERFDGNAVMSFAEDVAARSGSLPADGLAEEWLAAFRGLRQRMFDERTSAWFAAEDGFPLTFETPFDWDPYPHGRVTRMKFEDDDPDVRKPRTALVESRLTEHPVLGNGLELAVYVPDDPRGNTGRVINAMNRLDAEVAGASHSFGGWTMTETAAGDTAPGCVAFLPAAFAEAVTNLPLVMREIVLTLARQALLARRVLVPTDEQADGDRAPGIGLAIAADPLATFVRGPHGLAWGETGEGRNPAARVLDRIYDKCVGPDSDWADVRTDGFTWWPYQQAQDVSATLRSASTGVAQGVSVRIATEVRRGVAVTPDVLTAIAEVNAGLGQSALVLRDDGLLYLALRVYVHEGTDHWAGEWVKNLAAEQFITARDLSAKLGEAEGFGEHAVSAHSLSGPRPEPDELFGIRENYLIEAASSVREGLSPLVPLLALCRLYALPVDLSATGTEGGLDFTWRVSQTRAEITEDVAVRVSVRQGDSGSGPGWLIRVTLPVAGDRTARARWCNDRNAEMLGDGADDGDDVTMTGGWGLTLDGECCLIAWMSTLVAPDTIPLASGLIGNVLTYLTGATMVAIGADPEAMIPAPGLTPEELARGLSSVLETFRAALAYPEDFRWSAEPLTHAVLVTLTGPNAGVSPAEVTLAEASDSGPRTVLRIPLTRNRGELGLFFAAFLGRSATRIRSSSAQELIPGELWDWDFTWQHVEAGLGALEDEGLIDWDQSEGDFTFDVGPAGARLRFERVEGFRPHGGTALRLTATVPGVGLSALRTSRGRRSGDLDVLGSWRDGMAGLSYEVTIPPAGMIYGSDFTAAEAITWTGRHVVNHVRKSL